MVQEMKRSGWNKFCKQFSQQNQYRPAKITYSSPDHHEIKLGHGFPLLGLMLEKKGRLIDGVRLIAGQPDDAQVAVPVVSVKKPTKMMVHKSDDGNVKGLDIHSETGDVLKLELLGRREESQFTGLVEKVAYNLYERRGHSVGEDWRDWLEAEQKVRQIQEQLTH